MMRPFAFLRFQQVEQVFLTLIFKAFRFACSDSESAADPLKGLSPTTANQTAFFFLSLVRLGLVAAPVAVLVAAFVDAAAFFCRRASMNTFSFSGNPLFFAALLRALVNDFAANGVLMEKPYFFRYSF
jgi:hypothetical protein